MIQDQLEEAWVFRFGIESPHEDFLSEPVAQALLLRILDWVEEQGLQMGGSYLRGSTVSSPEWAEIQDLLRSETPTSKSGK